LLGDEDSFIIVLLRDAGRSSRTLCRSKRFLSEEAFFGSIMFWSRLSKCQNHIRYIRACFCKVYTLYISSQIRLYSRDMDLNSQQILHREVVTSPVVILSLVDNSLLVYTADNTLFHYLIVPTADTIKLHLCGSITFNGIIAAPSAVRLLSWMIPSAQKRMCV
jgi:hypothetical protein